MSLVEEMVELSRLLKEGAVSQTPPHHVCPRCHERAWCLGCSDPAAPGPMSWRWVCSQCYPVRREGGDKYNVVPITRGLAVLEVTPPSRLERIQALMTEAEAGGHALRESPRKKRISELNGERGVNAERGGGEQTARVQATTAFNGRCDEAAQANRAPGVLHVTLPEDVMLVVDSAGLEACRSDVEASHVVALDIETTGLSPYDADVLLVQLWCDAAGTTFVIAAGQVAREALADVLSLLPDRLVVAHNVGFEWSFLAVRYGIRLRQVWDTQVAEDVLHAGRVGVSSSLEDVARRRLNVTLDKQVRQTFVGADAAAFCPTPAQVLYAARDASILSAIREQQVRELEAQELTRTADLEMRVLPAVAGMQVRGVRLDREAHAALIASYQQTAETEGAAARALLEPHWQASQARHIALCTPRYDELGREIDALLEPYGGRLGARAPSDVRQAVEALRRERAATRPPAACALSLTSNIMMQAALQEAGVMMPNMQEETLAAHVGEHPAIVHYLAYKRAQKVVSTYGASIADAIEPATGRLHGHYKQVISTGRLMSSGPNMQNLPSAVRACFVPEPGHLFVVADYSGVELRVAAALSHDATMLAAFEAGVDLHAMTAAAVWPELYPTWGDVPKDSPHRAQGKTANFAILYGSSAQGLVTRGVVSDLPTAERIMHALARTYPTLMRWLETESAAALRRGYSLTVIGRKRYFPQPGPCPRDDAGRTEWNRLQRARRREAKNAPVQGSAADLAKTAMALLDERLPADAVLVAMVHDELLLEVPATKAQDVARLVDACMVDAGKPLFAGVITSAETHIADRWSKE